MTTLPEPPFGSYIDGHEYAELQDQMIADRARRPLPPTGPPSELESGPDLRWAFALGVGLLAALLLLAWLLDGSG